MKTQEPVFVLFVLLVGVTNLVRRFIFVSSAIFMVVPVFLIVAVIRNMAVIIDLLESIGEVVGVFHKWLKVFAKVMVAEGEIGFESGT